MASGGSAGSERSARILLVDDEHSVQTLLAYPLRKDGYEVVRRARRARGARPLRRAAVRPRRARHHAAEARRDRGLPPDAQPQPGADHHAHRKGRRDRQGARPRDGRRRLHHQAVLGRASSAAASGPRCGAPRCSAPRPGGDEPIAAGALEIDFERRVVTVRRRARAKLTYVEFEILATLAGAPGRVMTREMLLEQHLGRLGLPRPAHDRRPHPPPAREARARRARAPSTCSRSAASATDSGTRGFLARSRMNLDRPRPVAKRRNSVELSFLELGPQQAGAPVLRDHGRGGRLHLPLRGPAAALEPDGGEAQPARAGRRRRRARGSAAAMRDGASAGAPAGSCSATSTSAAAPG